jgi:hypothetical protein
MTVRWLTSHGSEFAPWAVLGHELAPQPAAFGSRAQSQPAAVGSVVQSCTTVTASTKRVHPWPATIATAAQASRGTRIVLR